MSDSPEKTKLFSESVVWTAGELGLETFYVYGLLAANETIFAFSEARIERHDRSPHHIAMKTSRDSGETWSENRFVAVSRDGECFCNPTPVFDRGSGKLFLFYARNRGNETSEVFLVSSADGGANWTAPRNLTALFDDNYEGWTFHLPGPGHGLQMRSGRLILPVWHRRSIEFPAEARSYAVSVVYSDDGGATWEAGGVIPARAAQLNESRIIERRDRRLTINARSGAFRQSPRYFSHSFDGGRTWTKAEKVDSLPEAFATDSGFINFEFEGRDYLLATRPAAVAERKHLTLYLSADNGRTFPNSVPVYEGFAGYSDASVIDGKTIGVIYGRDLIDENGDVEGNAKQTVFAKIGIERLIEEII
ncbi:MAG TPA: sialidase family protein [Pyrinomonadaceae bacterium]